MRNSRLKTPDIHFVQVNYSIAREQGRVCAFVIGVLDYNDRTGGKYGQPMRRADIVWRLIGLAGHDAIDKSLRELTKLKWICKTTVRVKNNVALQDQYSLNPEKINSDLSGDDSPSVESSNDGQDEDENDDQNDDQNVKPPITNIKEKDKEIDTKKENIEKKPQPPKSSAAETDAAHGVSSNQLVELTNLSLQSETVKRLAQTVEHLKRDEVNKLIEVLKVRVPSARTDRDALAMTLSRAAVDGLLTPNAGVTTATQTSANQRRLTVELVCAFFQNRGKTVMKGHRKVAEFQDGWLYLDGRRYDESTVAMVLDDLGKGILTLK